MSRGMGDRLLNRSLQDGLNIIRALGPGAPLSPWTVYASPDAVGTGAWRTVRVHSGTIDGVHPRSAGDDSFSDDTDLDGTGKPQAAEMDMELSAGKRYFIVAVQTRLKVDGTGSGKKAWDIDKTFLFFAEATESAFPGQATFDSEGKATTEEQSNIFRNAYYRTIAVVTVGSDTVGAGDYHKLKIVQVVSENIVDGFVKPAHEWEPVITIDDPNDPNGSASIKVQNGTDADHAGNVLGLDGTVTQVDSIEEVYTPQTALSAWLKVSVTVADGSLEAEVVTTDPSAEADPFNTTTAVLIFPLFKLESSGSVAQYESGDINLQGLLEFADSPDFPYNISPEEGDAGTSKHPAREDHSHKLDLKLEDWPDIPVAEDLGSANTAGTSSYPARADHVHKKQDIPAVEGFTGSITVHAGAPTVSGSTLTIPTLTFVFANGLLTAEPTAGTDVTLDLETC